VRVRESEGKDPQRLRDGQVVYFFPLLTESLVERTLRQAMRHHGDEALPLYPEDLACRHPTARRLFDVFEPVQRHVLTCPGYSGKTDGGLAESGK
jgi:hypothetical protein